MSRKSRTFSEESGRNLHRFLDRDLDSWEGKNSLSKFEFREISLIEMSKIISSMSNSTAMGHDSIDSRGISDVQNQLVKQIRHLINLSLMTGKFAHKWKFAKLSPRLKSHDLDRNSPSEYRPVAILPVISKLVEQAAQLQLLNYLERTRQINSSCHAYRKNYSTTTTLMEIMDEKHQSTEDKCITSLMTLNPTAAFDTVSHHLLIEKLQQYSVGPAALEWVRNDLSARTQYVVLGRTLSSMKSIICGVPQGSVISLLLYTVFINNMSESVKRPNCQNVTHLD